MGTRILQLQLSMPGLTCPCATAFKRAVLLLSVLMGARVDPPVRWSLEGLHTALGFRVRLEAGSDPASSDHTQRNRRPVC